jgi:hypothetical protein
MPVPDNFLSYLDTLVEEAMSDVHSALDDLGDYKIAMARAGRLALVLQIRTEAGEYEPA